MTSASSQAMADKKRGGDKGPEMTNETANTYELASIWLCWSTLTAKYYNPDQPVVAVRIIFFKD